MKCRPFLLKRYKFSDNGASYAVLSLRVETYRTFEYSKMADGRHLVFDRTRNNAIRSANRPKPYPIMKHEVDRMTCCGGMVSWNMTYHEECIRDPHFEGRGCTGHRPCHWKERWWFPIRRPLWALHYLWPFGRNLPSNVCDVQLNRGWVTLGHNFRE